MPGMEASRGLRQLENHDIGRQQIVHPSQDNIRFVTNRSADFDVGDLTERMDTGVGSAGALHLDIALEYFLSGLSQLAHHGASVLLFLPAAVPAAIVFEQELECGHSAVMLRSAAGHAVWTPARTHNLA